MSLETLNRLCYTINMASYVETTVERIKQLGGVEGVALSELTGFKVGGMADYYLKVTSYEQLIEAVALCRSEGVPFCLLGNGTNVLASDDGFKGVVIHFHTPLHLPVWQEGRVTVCAGTSLTGLAKEAVRLGWMGLERLHGIPGTVGGACAMNAGAYGAEIKDVLKRVRILRNGEDEWVEVRSSDLGYRKSAFSFPDCIVLEAELLLKPDAGSAQATMQECYQKRKEKQPLQYPSAGSTFKRPEGHFAGALIERCGLKGTSVGGAQVSEKHAGFIINKGGATEADISELIALVQRTVLEQTGVSLECEVKRI